MQYNAVAFLESLFADSEDAAKPLRHADIESPAITVNDLPADWHFLWDERAAIMEYDGRMPREHAEAAALADILRRMRQAGIGPQSVPRAVQT
jgi:hypothetical protein